MTNDNIKDCIEHFYSLIKQSIEVIDQLEKEGYDIYDYKIGEERDTIQVSEETLNKLSLVYETTIIEKPYKADIGMTKGYDTEGSFIVNGIEIFAIYKR
jgi:hypothetical protein